MHETPDGISLKDSGCTKSSISLLKNNQVKKQCNNTNILSSSINYYSVIH